MRETKSWLTRKDIWAFMVSPAGESGRSGRATTRPQVPRFLAYGVGGGVARIDEGSSVDLVVRLVAAHTLGVAGDDDARLGGREGEERGIGR